MNGGELAALYQPLHRARVDVKQLCRLRRRQQCRSRPCRGSLDGRGLGATGDDTATRLRQVRLWRDARFRTLVGIELEQWKRELTWQDLHRNDQ